MDHVLDKVIAEPDRVAEILERVSPVFANRGFDGASMQDLARAAGMSAGNFYRYFQSKEDIITAICHRDSEQIRAEFAEILASSDPALAFREIFHRHVLQGKKDGALWVQIEAAAALRPNIAKHLAATEATIVEHLIAVFAHLSGKTHAEISRDHAARMRLIILLVRELSVRAAGQGGFRPAEFDHEFAALMIQTIEKTITEIMGCDVGTILNQPEPDQKA